MEHVDLLYSGLIATALMLSLWAALLATAAWLFFAREVEISSVRNSLDLPSMVPRSSSLELPTSSTTRATLFRRTKDEGPNAAVKVHP